MPDRPPQSIASRNAEWAQTFEPTNLAQRQRNAEAIDTARMEESTKNRNASDRRELLDPKGYGKFMQDRREFEQKRTMDNFKADLDLAKFDWDQEKAKIQQELNLRKNNLDLAREKRLFQAAQHEMADAERSELQTGKVQQTEADLRAKGVLPGTRAYRDSMINELVNNPYVPSDFRKMLIDRTGIQMDERDLIEEGMKLKEANPNGKLRISESIGSDGMRKFNLSLAEPTESTRDTEGPLRNRMDKLTKELDTLPRDEKNPSGMSPERRSYVESEINQIRSKLNPVPHRDESPTEPNSLQNIKELQQQSDIVAPKPERPDLNSLWPKRK